MVASAVALYINRYPNATDSNVKRCIIETAYHDAFTGPASGLPNYNWGYGKLNAFDAIVLCPNTTGIATIESPNTFTLIAYPNPFSNNTQINYDFSSIKDFNTASILVYDVMGKAVKTLVLKGNQGTVTMNKANLASGIYFYSLIVDGVRLKTEKLEVL
jgi:hypothetical protein